MLNQDEQSNYENQMFISINANDNLLNDQFIYYYPSQKVNINKMIITPIHSNLALETFKNNVEKYQEIKESVLLLVCLNLSKTAYNISTGNIIKIKDYNKEKICVLSSFSLIRFPDYSDEDLIKLDVFIVSDTSNTEQFFKKLEFIINCDTIEYKLNYINNLKNEFKLLSIKKSIDTLKYRREFIKSIEQTDYEFLLKDPIDNKIISPCMDILILDLPENHGGYRSYIEIDIEYYESDKVEIDQKQNICTFITHHIPRQKIEEFEGRSKKLNIIRKKIENNNLKYYFTNNHKNIFYDKIRDLEFSNACCIYYEKSINFGTVVNNYYGISNGQFTFNKNSAGTILFDLSFKPIGISFHGSYDFYPLNNYRKKYNVFISFKHIGILYIIKKFLNSSQLNIDYFSEKKNSLYEIHKNFNREEVNVSASDQTGLRKRGRPRIKFSKKDNTPKQKNDSVEIHTNSNSMNTQEQESQKTDSVIDKMTTVKSKKNNGKKTPRSKISENFNELKENHNYNKNIFKNTSDNNQYRIEYNPNNRKKIKEHEFEKFKSIVDNTDYLKKKKNK